eukprot:TRINITY_DN30930_c0_g1_i1.p1 TRINITY_DN30930_c0_g1~~TRINITY_DN30930_c0_g1_i1.p1  ORF type:complete len:180 (+),score=18.57 TRINITY_DN30930_c0_g1_i1:59-598(+)
MGCTESKEAPKSQAPTQKAPVENASSKQVWQNGEVFPSQLVGHRIQRPDRKLEGVTLVDCLVDNARDFDLERCTLRNCKLINCHLKDCTIEAGTEVNRCVVKGGTSVDATLTSGTEVSENCEINRCMVTDRCTIRNCTIGRDITTTGSMFYSCNGNPQPPPNDVHCNGCIWGEQAVQSV